jgi:hypothetical protein
VNASSWITAEMASDIFITHPFKCHSCNKAIVVEHESPLTSPAAMFQAFSLRNFRKENQSVEILQPLINDLHIKFNLLVWAGANTDYRSMGAELLRPRTRAWVNADDTPLELIISGIESGVRSVCKQFDGSTSKFPESTGVYARFANV